MTGRNHTRICEVCGCVYQPKLKKNGEPIKSKHNVCGNRCRCKKYKRGRPSRSKAPASATCITCGNKYQPTRSDNTHFCSRTCLGYWHNHSDKYHHGPIRPDIKIKVDGPHVVAPCLVCGAFEQLLRKNSAALCKIHRTSFEYHNLNNLLAGALERKCSECGVDFCNLPGNGGKRTCSDGCFFKSQKRYKRKAKAKRRAKQRGIESDSIDPIAVFERDRWKCHICGKLTLKSKRGTNHDRAPELEHIVSLADGGAHTWGNVACACRKCNGDKGAASFGQINLGFSF